METRTDRRCARYASRRGPPKPQRQRISPGKALRLYCLACLGAKDSRAAFDCLTAQCALYCACPFRDKPMPKSFRPRVTEEAAERLIRAVAKQEEGYSRIPKRRACASMLSRYCRNECQPGDRTDCKDDSCPLYAWHSYKSGGTMNRPISQKKLTAVRQNLLGAVASPPVSKNHPIREPLGA